MTNLRILSDLLISQGLLTKPLAAMDEQQVQKLCACVLAATPHVAIAHLSNEAQILIENVFKVFNTGLQEQAPCWKPNPDLSSFGIVEKDAFINMIENNRQAKGLPPLPIPENLLKFLASDKVSFKGFILMLHAWALDMEAWA